MNKMTESFWKVFVSSPWAEPLWRQVPPCTGWSSPGTLPSWMASWGRRWQISSSGSLWLSKTQSWTVQRLEPGPWATLAPRRAPGWWRAALSPVPWRQDSVRVHPPPPGPLHRQVLLQPRISRVTARRCKKIIIRAKLFTDSHNEKAVKLNTWGLSVQIKSHPPLPPGALDDSSCSVPSSDPIPDQPGPHRCRQFKTSYVF